MGNLIRMDIYRMRKAKSFWACIITAFVFALGQTPMLKLLAVLGKMLTGDEIIFPAASLADIFREPFPLLNAMLVLLSACFFCYADVENGYIKNIAGQMPKRGFTVLSKFIALIGHNLAFMLLGVIGNLAGTAIVQRITLEGDILGGLLVFVEKFLLIQSICAILVLVTASFRSKSLGIVLAVLMGMGLLGVLYGAIDAGLNQLLRLQGFSISNYMPDQLLNRASPDALTSILVSVVVTAIFLPLAIRVFDRRDVK